jgi:hypothetical protein
MNYLRKRREVGNSRRVSGPDKVKALVSGETIDQISSERGIQLIYLGWAEVMHYKKMASSIESQYLISSWSIM